MRHLVWKLRRLLDNIFESKDKSFDERYELVTEKQIRLKPSKEKASSRFRPARVVGGVIVCCFIFTLLIQFTIGRDVTVNIVLNEPDNIVVVKEESKSAFGAINGLSKSKEEPITDFSKDLLGNDLAPLPLIEP